MPSGCPRVALGTNRRCGCRLHDRPPRPVVLFDTEISRESPVFRVIAQTDGQRYESCSGAGNLSRNRARETAGRQRTRRNQSMQLTVLGQEDVAAPKGGCAASSCGSNDDQLNHLPESIRERVYNHPCYSEQAHHHFARMHVAVAPACNIQCHYCNRKYDCANESRPGVVSELLTPEQAVKKTHGGRRDDSSDDSAGNRWSGRPARQPRANFRHVPHADGAGTRYQTLRVDQRPGLARQYRRTGRGQHRSCHNHDQLPRSRGREGDLPLGLLAEQAGSAGARRPRS